jgi:hypothetical protein
MELAFIFSASALIIGSIAMIVALLSYVDVKAMQKSTHQIQYVYPNEGDSDQFENIDKKTRAKLEDESDLFDDETNFGELT